MYFYPKTRLIKGAFLAVLAIFFVFLALIVLPLVTNNALAATTCNSNSQYPLRYASASGACVGQVDSKTYSIEFDLCTYSTDAELFTLSGSSLYTSPNGKAYDLHGVNSCGSQGGGYFVSWDSGKDKYGDDVSVLINATSQCTNSIVLKVVDPTTNKSATTNLNPCDIIKSAKSSLFVYNIANFKDPGPQYGGGNQSTCKLNSKFPMYKSAFTDACLGAVDDTQQSWEFLIYTKGFTNPSIAITGTDLKSQANQFTQITQYTDTSGGTVQLHDTYASSVSGKDSSGNNVGVLLKNVSNCGSNDVLTIAVNDANGNQGSTTVDPCGLELHASCWNYSAPQPDGTLGAGQLETFNISPGHYDHYQFTSYGCPNQGGNNCSPSPPLYTSFYNSQECLGPIAAKCTNCANKDLVNVDIVVHIQNTGWTDPLLITLTDTNNELAGRITACSVYRDTHRDKNGFPSGPECPPDDQEPFSAVSPTLYHPSLVGSISFPYIHPADFNAQPNNVPDQTSSVGLMKNVPCDPSEVITVTAIDKKTFYSGRTNLRACDIIKSNYTKEVSVFMAADALVCNTGDGWLGVAAWALCPALKFMVSGIQFLTYNFIVPFGQTGI